MTVDADLRNLWIEYAYRKLFPMSHNEYLEEPIGIVEWLVAIHNEMESSGRELSDNS